MAARPACPRSASARAPARRPSPPARVSTAAVAAARLSTRLLTRPLLPTDTAFCAETCGFCREVDADPNGPQPPEASRRYDVYMGTFPAGELCLGDNSASGADAMYLVLFGPESPDQPLPGCDGVPGSGAFEDACGVCGGESSCVGCDGVANSGLELDQCGDCGGANACEPTDSEMQITFAGDTQLGRYVDQMLPFWVQKSRDPNYDRWSVHGEVETRSMREGRELRRQADLASLSIEEQFRRP